MVYSRLNIFVNLLYNKRKKEKTGVTKLKRSVTLYPPSPRRNCATTYLQVDCNSDRLSYLISKTFLSL